jgi:hypothetical protein
MELLMPPRPDLSDALLTYDRFWRDLFEETEDDEGVKSFVDISDLRDGAYALMRHARALEDYFAGRWEPADPAPADVEEEDPSYSKLRVFSVLDLKIDSVLVKKFRPLWRTPPPCSAESVEGARLFWRIARQINPVAVASIYANRQSLLDDLERLHTHFTERLEGLAAAFVHPMPAFAAPSAGAKTDAPASGADVDSGAGASGDGEKARRVKGDLWFELTDDGARVKSAYLASGKKTGAVTFGDQTVQRAAEQLLIRAAADGSFTREDIRDVLDEFRMSDASQDKVRDELDYAICRAVGAVGKGRQKPKAFTLANKRYTSDIQFRCLNGDDAQARQNRQAAVEAYAQSVGRKGDRKRSLHCFNEEGDEVDPPSSAGTDGGDGYDD